MPNVNVPGLTIKMRFFDVRAFADQSADSERLKRNNFCISYYDYIFKATMCPYIYMEILLKFVSRNPICPKHVLFYTYIKTGGFIPKYEKD